MSEDVLITSAQWQRNIGGIVADVTVEEVHRDELVVTEHPVEQGAAITDHSYKRPAEVIITGGWSNSSVQAGGDEGYVFEMYQKLLDLQAGRTLLTVLTGKRRYTNMLITNIETQTDYRFETSTIFRASLKEVIVVPTVETAVPPPAVHTQPEKTAPVQSTGVRQLGPAPNYNAQ